MSSNGDNLGLKLVINYMNLIICIKQIFDAAEFAHQIIVGNINMRLPYTCVLIKNVAISGNRSTMCLKQHI